jgi:hypothetical protein
MAEAADQWYTSATFWAAAAVLVALIVGVPTFWVTWVPRQRLFYGTPPPTPLLTAGTAIDDLEIRHRGRHLTAPHLLDVTLTARGRRDIPSSAFDQGRPLVFDVGAAIVETLQIRSDPTSAMTPPVTHDGSALSVGPELIGRRQTIIISLLVDGTHPRLTCTQPILAQVTVIPRDPSTSTEPSNWAAAMARAEVAGAGRRRR